MKRFSFHLEPLLRLRSHKEEEWRIKLGEASSRSNAIRENITLLHQNERTASITPPPASPNSNMSTIDGQLDIEYYWAREQYVQRMRSTIAELEQEYEEAELERKKVLSEYERVRKEYRAIQMMKEKRLQEYRKVWLREEEKERDDIVSSRPRRKG